MHYINRLSKSSKSATMGFMPDPARMIRKSISPLQRKNVKLFFLLIVGAIVHYLPLDMDYFLSEDDEFGEDFPGAKGFYIF